MPFINVKTNINIDNTKEIEIKEELGKLIEIIPGKSESWLMVNIEDDSKLYFKGSKDEANLFVEVKIYGNVSSTNLNKFTEAATNKFNNILGIAKDRMYFKYELVDNWGWNGNNF